MAMTYQNFASLGVNLNRQKYGPLDISNVFTSAADLKYYLTKGTYTTDVSEYWYKNANEKIVPYPYEGQVLATVIDGVVNVYALSVAEFEEDGTTPKSFKTQEIGAEIKTDEKTIKLVNGKLELVGLPSDVSGKTFVPSLVNGVLTWAEPDTSTAEGQQQAIDGLTASVAGLGEILNGKPESEEGAGDAVVGLVDKVAALEAVDNATQAELDAYKDVVTAAIAAGVKEAKDYADAQDADTIYDDSALAARVKAIEDDYLVEADKYDDTDVKARIKAIEDDYLKTADKYDDTALAGRVTTAEGKIADLEAAVEAIDYVDTDELTEAIKDFATDKELADGLALKADKEDFDDLKSTVDAFLTGEGTEAALDSLKELIAYIDEHDGADLTEMIATIERIEGKLEGIDSTVADYVKAAIDAIKIEDYAKASDLADLAGKVAALEAKPFDTYATKTEVQGVDAKFAQYTTTSDLTNLLADKADADAVVANDTFAQFKTDNTAAIEAAQNAAVAAAKSETETQVGNLADSVAETYATKDALTEAVEGIENDLLAYEKTTDLTTKLAGKADVTSVYTKGEVDTKIGTPGVPAEVDSDGNEITPAVPGTGVFANAYSRAEVDKLLDEVQGGSSASADSVLRQLNTYKSTNDERVGNIEAKDTAQDASIAAALEQANKGVSDAAKVASDLAALDARVVSNTNEITVVKGSITTVNETLSGKITTLENRDVELAGLISGLDTAVKDHATTLGEHTAAITTLQTKDTELAALIQGNTNKFADYSTTTQMNAAIAAAITGADLDSYAKKTEVTLVADDLAKEVVRATAAEQANTDAIAVLVGTVEGDNAKSIRTIAAEETAKIVAGADAKYDTLKEIADFIMNDETGAAAMANDIAALKTVVGDEASGLVKAVADQDAAIKAIIQPKASTEVTVAEDGTLGLGAVSTDKLVQGVQELIIIGGSATT